MNFLPYEQCENFINLIENILFTNLRHVREIKLFFIFALSNKIYRVIKISEPWNIGQGRIMRDCSNFPQPDQGRHSFTKTCLFKYIENFTTENWKFSDKNCDNFHISAQIECGYSLEQSGWGSSDEYPQSMFLSRIKKNNVYSCTPQFYCTKVGFKGVNII